MSQETVGKAVDFAAEPKVSGPNISFIKADLTDMAQCKKIFSGADYIVMLAAKISRRSRDFESNYLHEVVFVVEVYDISPLFQF